MARLGRAQPAPPFLGRRIPETPVAAITTGPFKNNTGTLLTSLTVPNVLVIRLSTKAIVLTLTNQVTHASTAVLSIANAALVAGVDYLVASFDDDGNPAGIELYTAA